MIKDINIYIQLFDLSLRALVKAHPCFYLQMFVELPFTIPLPAALESVGFLAVCDYGGALIHLSTNILIEGVYTHMRAILRNTAVMLPKSTNLFNSL